MSHVFIPLNAFSDENGLQYDIHFYISTIASSNADGIEIRRELLNSFSFKKDLQNIYYTLKQHSLFTVYSAPIPIWNKDYSLNEAAVAAVMEEANIIRAKWVKLPLGHFDDQKSDLQALHLFLKKYSEIQLLIENDQTMEGGQVKNLLAFFKNAEIYPIPVKMTFDIGNWMYLQENAADAAALFASYVSYFHLKHVVKKKNEWITVPIPNEEDALWKIVDKTYFPFIPKALEFQLAPTVSEINSYIDLIKGNKEERAKTL
ncbi:hypothetical protein [Niallia sp. 03133]|uniref:hypothetical protein n=1 Tax=Niallia sp. 03133 TaxID=3458060 RepID=UPI004044B484